MANEPNVQEMKSTRGILIIVNSALILIALAIFDSVFQSWIQFVKTTIVSGFVYTLSLIIIYLWGDGKLQLTFYEVMLNSYFTLMFGISAILCWVNGSNIFYELSYNGILISTGLFCFFSCIVFAAETYMSLINSGTLDKLKDALHARNNPVAAHQNVTVPDTAQPSNIYLNENMNAPTYLDNTAVSVSQSNSEITVTNFDSIPVTPKQY